MWRGRWGGLEQPRLTLRLCERLVEAFQTCLHVVAPDHQRGQQALLIYLR